MAKDKDDKDKRRPQRREPKLISNDKDDLDRYADDEDYEEDEIEQAPRKPRASKKKPKAKKKQSSAKRIIWFCLWRFIILIILIISAGVGYICHDLPDISTFGEVKKVPSIIVKSDDGTVIGTYGDVYGDYVPYAQIPKSVINAVVATEDRNFFNHFGVDPRGFARAMYVNIKAKRMVQGGSTITQQLAKNLFLTPERKLKRKLQEMILALELENKFSKEEIMTIYLNRVYMGAGNFGVDAASRRYFGHSVREVNLSESAILIGLLKAPSRYAPTGNPDLSEKRATQVLLNMKDAGYLTDKQVEEAKANFNDEDSNYRDSHGFGSFYFSDWVVGQLPALIGEVNEDIVVSTTLKTDWQSAGEDAVNQILEEKGKNMKASQGALLSMSPDGAIRAMVGGRNYRKSQFNRATQGLRQPGSSFKLFVYLAALEAGFNPESHMIDQAISVGNWKPRNYSGKYEGEMTLTEAFAQSTNSIAVQLSETIGREHVVEIAKRLGISSELNPDPSIALGSNEASLYDMTKAYAHLASNGASVNPYAIQRVDTSSGRILFEHQVTPSVDVLSKTTVGMMNHMLIAVTKTGTGRGANFGRPIAGKTGTTSDYRDAWFIGFTPDLTTGVWVGNDDTSPMKKVSGGSLPASIWRQYMSEALKKVAASQIPEQTDSGISGQLLPWLTPQATPVPIKEETEKLPDIFSPAFTPVTSEELKKQAAPQEQNPIPEEEPTPEYKAPPSFWNRLLGDDKKEEN